MITIHMAEKQLSSITADIKLLHGENVFDIAREFFYENPELRDMSVSVIEETGEELYQLQWETNQVSPVYYVEEFWEYDICDSCIDFELLERGEVYLFLTLEEYTFQIVRIIQKKYPKKDIFFMDQNARFFFDETSHVHIISSLAELYNNYKKHIAKTILTIDSKKDFLLNEMRFIIKRYRSLSVMTGLFWKRNVVSFGSKNPDKTFYIINNCLEYGGLGDMIKHALVKVAMLEEKPDNIIPLIDFSNKEDINQFTNGSGENAWTLFFEQISDISLEEAYESQNVIVSSYRGWDLFNPYIYEKHCFIDWVSMFQKYIRINKKSMQYIEEMFEKIILDKDATILGAIGRGTDRWSQRGGTADPMEAGIFLKEVEKAFVEWNCDYIFLATEDEYLYEIFMKSHLKDKILSVNQERINYKEKRYEELLLAEIKMKEHKTGYHDTLQYLAILYILSKCDYLISTCDCGASLCAIGLNGRKYKNVKIF